jgi:glycosyltransferase involved in cell wall biosynthesis
MAQADAVTTLTAIERDHLTGLDIAPERIHVVGSGSDALSAEVDSGIDVMERYGLSAPLVLFIGRVGRDKGALHAAEAVRALSGQGVHVTLGLIGQIAPEFERYYGRLPAAARQIIRPLGVVDEPIKHALLSRAHALVLPSRVESFGLVFLEAWAHGVPIIGARAGGIPGVIDDEVNGFLVEYGDVQGLAERLGALVTNRALAHAMGECGRQKRDREYSWDAVCHRTLAAYEAAMADRATDSSTGGL